MYNFKNYKKLAKKIITKVVQIKKYIAEFFNDIITEYHNFGAPARI